MTVEERRRIALHRAAAASWGEEVADTLVELVAPSGHELATRADIRGVLDAMEAMDQRWDERFTAAEQRWDERFATAEQRWDERFATAEQRWDERFGAAEQRWDERLTTSTAQMESMEHRLQAGFERGIREAITAQTRTLVVSQLVAIVTIAGLAFGLGG
jgi:RNase H-fold protein (predicted Holliday junction resolvase)